MTIYEGHLGGALNTHYALGMLIIVMVCSRSGLVNKVIQRIAFLLFLIKAQWKNIATVNGFSVLLWSLARVCTFMCTVPSHPLKNRAPRKDTA